MPKSLPASFKDLPDFLRKHVKRQDQELTHTAIGDPKSYGITDTSKRIYGASYAIPDNKSDIFLELYDEYVFNQNNKSYLTEKHLDGIGPIVIDLDFRFAGKIDDHPYTLEFVKEFLKIFTSELLGIVDIPLEYLTSFVMEKPKPKYLEDKDLTKDGIHIMMPFAIVTPKLQFAIRYKCINNMKMKSLFKEINCTNKADDIFDKCVIDKNNWQMYGSRKPHHSAYRLTEVINYNFIYSDDNSPMALSKQLEEGQEPDLLMLKTKVAQFSNKELLRLLSVRNFNKKYIYNYSEEEIGKIEEIKIPDKEKTKKKMNGVKKRRSPVNKKHATAEEFIMAREMVTVLNNRRINDYESWLNLGFCLHNIDDRLLEDWISFSKKSNKYVEGECESMWSNMDNEGLAFGSLCLWAREDDPVKFKKIKTKSLNGALIQSLSGTHTDIAEVIYKCYKGQFVCASVGKKRFYEFKNHRWRLTDDGVSLRIKISNELVNTYMEFQNSLNEQALKETNPSNKELIIDKSNKVSKVIISLKKTSFKKSLLDECAEKFYLEKFEEKLDANPNIMCFENGVYDLKGDLFRDGNPEDYCSFSTGIYYSDFEEDDETIEEVQEFLKQVLTKQAVREYVMRLMASFLSGEIHSEKFHIWTGIGGNGKSKLIELLRKCIGDYACTLPVALITQKRGRAEGATPALAATQGKRFACLQEPEGDETINVGLMKELTGGDTIIARKMYAEPVEFKPQFKMLLTCNILPDIKSSDRGTWRRVRAVEFTSVFTDNPDPNDPCQFQIDEDLDAKLDNWKEAFIYILLKEFAQFREFGIYEPDEVKKFTKEYQNESDYFTQFFEECIVITDNSADGITLNDIIAVYQDWFPKNIGTNIQMPKRKDIKTNISKKYGAPKSGSKWFGIALKELTFQDDDTDI